MPGYKARKREDETGGKEDTVLVGSRGKVIRGWAEMGMELWRARPNQLLGDLPTCGGAELS